MLSVSGEADVGPIGGGSKNVLSLPVVINTEPMERADEDSNRMGFSQVPPLICEQGPSTPSSPIASPTSRLTKLQLPNLCVSSNERINRLSPGFPLGIDFNKLSPFRTGSTSDLGSSPRSSFSTTPNSLGNPWTAFRDFKRSNQESDADSDVFSKDLLSPSVAYSPSPFSPFSDCSEPPDTPHSLSAYLGNSPSVSPRLPLHCLHFSFDDATSIENDMDWSELPMTSKDPDRPSRRLPNFAIETVLSLPEEINEAKQLDGERRDSAESPPLRIVDDEPGPEQASVMNQQDEYVERQLAQWKSVFSERCHSPENAHSGPAKDAADGRKEIPLLEDWDGLKPIGGPLMAPMFWHKSRSTPNIAVQGVACNHCSESFTNQEDLQRHITLQHPDVCEMSINVRRCLLCFEFFKDNESLRQHVVMKHPSKEESESSGFLCHMCNETFLSSDDLVKHISTRHLENLHRSAFCQMFGKQMRIDEQNSVESARNQLGVPTVLPPEVVEETLPQSCIVTKFEDASGDEVVQCTSCNEIVKKEHLRQHLISKHDEHYPCPQCPKVFNGKEGLRDHIFMEHLTAEERENCRRQNVIKQHEAEKNVFHCVTCQQAFPNQERCNVHIAMEHPMQPLLEEPQKCSCLLCSQAFVISATGIQDLSRDQILLKQVKEEIVCDKFRCPECGKLFPTRNHVEEHEAVVHQEPSTSNVPFGKFVCQFCNEGFSNQDRLTKHIASRHRNPVEEAQKAHKCMVCGKGFARTDMLSRHMRLHKGDKPFSCSVCGQEFSRSDHLTTHMRTHSGEKPYRCPHCSYAASRRDMMNRHMKTHSKSPEHIKAQEANRLRSCSVSPNPGSMNLQFGSTVGALPPIGSSGPQQQPQQLIPPLQNYFALHLPVPQSPVSEKNYLSFPQIVTPVPQIVIPAQQNDAAAPQPLTPLQQNIASALNCYDSPIRTESLSALQFFAASPAPVSNPNLLAPPSIPKASSLPPSPKFRRQQDYNTFFPEERG